MFLLSFCSFLPNGDCFDGCYAFSLWRHRFQKKAHSNGALETHPLLRPIEHSISSGCLFENDDVTKRKLVTDEIISIGYKQAKRKQKHIIETTKKVKKIHFTENKSWVHYDKVFSEIIAIKKYVGRVNKPDHLANDHLLRKNLNNWMCSYNLRVMEIAILLQRRKLLVAIFFTIFTCGGAHDLKLPFSHPHLKPVEFFHKLFCFPFR